MFVHLHVHSPYSFLDGASDLEALVQRAATLGMPALALTDHNTLSAAVKFTSLCRGYAIKPILGAEVTMADGSHLTLLCQNANGYANLCHLLSLAYAHGGRQTPNLPWNHLPQHTKGILCLTGCRKGKLARLVGSHRYEEAKAVAVEMQSWFGADHFFIELVDDFTPYCHRICRNLLELAEAIGAASVITNNVHYATPRSFPVHDILRCIEGGITVAQEAETRPLNFERWLKPAAKMAELFSWCPEALAQTIHIAEMCEEALPTPEQVTPRYPSPEGHDAASYLRHLSYKGGKARYKDRFPSVQARLDQELSIICQLGYADYILLAWKVARWARQQGIRCTGRGSAADSAVCYSLMLTDVDVIARNLPFARFLAPGKTPDIDLDFDAFRRDEVFRWLQQEYGTDRVAMACTFHTYHAKGALRDVGKGLGLPADILAFFSQHVAGFVRADKIEEAFGRYPELKPHHHLKARFRLLFDLCRRIAGFPRHIGTHSSGVVVSAFPLDRLGVLQSTAKGVLPLIQLDKDDVEEMGALKLDVLSLRILSAVEEATISIQKAQPNFRYEAIPHDDPATYKMIGTGYALGAFQLESPAQMALGCSLEPQNLEDLVASVALIRPGPIRSSAVRRFIGARNGWSRADCLHPSLIPVLAKTYGCVIFQEQVVQVIAAMLGCNDAEADKFRKGLSKHEKWGTLEEAMGQFIAAARRQHPELSPDRALLIWQQIESWGAYGFTEGHAASFAITASKSAYLSLHHPTAYFAGMMSSMPMGFYSANTLATEARRRGVEILSVDINASEWKCTVDEEGALRLGFCLVDGMREEDAKPIVKARQERPFASLLDFCTRLSCHRDRLENLILAGAFQRLHEHQRGILWRLEETLALASSYRAGNQNTDQLAVAFDAADVVDTPVAWELEDLSPWEKLQWEWRVTGVVSSCHPFAYLREALRKRNVLSVHEAMKQNHGSRVTIAGLNLRPHRPPTRSGRTVLFTTVEDETDYLQIACVGEALEKCTSVFLLSPAVLVRGLLKRRGTGVSLTVEQAKTLRMEDFVFSDDNDPQESIVPGLHVSPPKVEASRGVLA